MCVCECCCASLFVVHIFIVLITRNSSRYITKVCREVEIHTRAFTFRWMFWNIKKKNESPCIRQTDFSSMLIHSKTIDNLLTKKRFAYKFWYLFSLVWKCLKRIRSPLCLKRMKKSNFVDIHFFFRSDYNTSTHTWVWGKAKTLPDLLMSFILVRPFQCSLNSYMCKIPPENELLELLCDIYLIYVLMCTYFVWKESDASDAAGTTY